MTRIDAKQRASIARLQREVKYDEGRPALRSTLVSPKVKQGTREIDLAAVAATPERTAVKSSKGSGTEKSKECKYCVAQYPKRVFRL